MHRVRLLPLVALAVVSALVLTGCRSQPGAAAYIGDTRFTESQIEGTVTTLTDEVKKAGGDLAPERRWDLRQELVRITIFNEIARRYLDEKKVKHPEVNYAEAAQQFGLPESSQFVRLVAESNAYRDFLLANVQPARLSEAEAREIYDRAAAAGLLPPGTAFADVAQGIAQDEKITAAQGVRNELVAAARRYDISVNPRYQPLVYPLYQVPNQEQQRQVDVVVLPLGDASPVEDLP